MTLRTCATALVLLASCGSGDNAVGPEPTSHTGGGAAGHAGAGGGGGGAEVCGNGLDDDGDGQSDEACSCAAGATQPCFTGPPASDQKGACKRGTQTCQGGKELAGTWGACQGSVVPVAEVCANSIDDDCDGKVDEDCGCTQGAKQSCDSGSSNECGTGQQTCTAGAWGPCALVQPAAETCDNGIDDDCNGLTDEICGSVPPEIEACDTATKISQSFDIVFPSTKGKCVWDHGTASGVMMGHLFETQSVPVLSGRIMCGIEISSSAPQLYYDDFILLHFDERALIGSTGMIDLLGEDALGLPLFDWSKLLGKSPKGGTTTCIPGATACALPGTEKTGPLKLSLDATTNKKLATVAHMQKKFDITVVTTGDNNGSVDCGHTELPITIVVQYYVK
jgi:hypothetical protein